MTDEEKSELVRNAKARQDERIKRWKSEEAIVNALKQPPIRRDVPEATNDRDD